MSGASEGARVLLITAGGDASNGVLVSLRDSGPGLDSASLERLFDAFYTTKSSGLGLGQASAIRSSKRTADGFGPARMSLEAPSFQFTLPLEREETVAAEPAGPMPAV